MPIGQHYFVDLGLLNMFVLVVNLSYDSKNSNQIKYLLYEARVKTTKHKCIRLVIFIKTQLPSV